MSTSRVVIAGGTGLIGQAVAVELTKVGLDPIILSRTSGPGRVTWDTATDELQDAAGLINLVGETINQRWTPDARRRILDSRVGSVRRLADLLRPLPIRPAVWVQGTATGLYGNRVDEILNETSAPGPEGHFLVDTCRAWEDAFLQACPGDVTPVRVRTGIVLAREGGAYPVLAKLTKGFLGGAVGSGQQWMSWIHIQDIARMFVHAVQHPATPILNGTAPTPARNREFMEALRKSLHRPWSPPAPALALQLLNKVGGPEPALVLEGQRVLPEAALQSGFTFDFPLLEDALRDLAQPKV